MPFPRIRLRPAQWLQRHEHRLRRGLTAATVVLLQLGVLLPTSARATTGALAVSTLRIAHRRDVAPTPAGFAGSRVAGRAGAEASARALAVATAGVPLDGPRLRSWTTDLARSPATVCPPSDLVVSWAPPVGNFHIGAYVAPLGPTPTAATTRVNGIVTCLGSTYAYLGFEAEWVGHRWHLVAVPPATHDGDAPLLLGEAETAGAESAAPAAAPNGDAVLPPPAAWQGAPIEALAAYVPQTTCDPVAKPGVLGFRDLLLSSFPGSRNLGIGRACEAEGVSEHKEGRAFDWGVSADVPAERADVDAVLSWLFATDADGNAEAMARRLGLMYVIWDEHIWSAAHDDEGWRPYVGVSTHRDHVHFSFSWDGALARTSFWAGGHAPAITATAPDLPLTHRAPALVPGLPLAPPPLTVGPGVLPPTPTAPGPAPSSAPPPSTTTTTAPPPSESTSTTTTTTTTTTTAPPAPAPAVTVPPIGVGGI